uniref:Nucleolar protein 12 n=1 Tax=Aureoumbra lagunensis TaxID=44058 RepID=A0A6S8DTH4_9STRA
MKGKSAKKKEAKKNKGKTGTRREEAGTFDNEAREEWLTGFRKRKRERRLRGLAYGALKERQNRLAARAVRREAIKERIAALPEVPKIQSKLEEEKVQISTFDDQELMEQWGNEVTVTTTLGFTDDDDDAFLRIKKPEFIPQHEERNEKERQTIDVHQLHAGSLEAMCKKLAGKVSSSAKASRRHARARDRRAAAKVGKHLGRPSSDGTNSSAPSTAKRNSRGPGGVAKGGASRKRRLGRI